MNNNADNTRSGILNKLLWAGVVVLCVIACALVALHRREPVNAAWLVIASVCIYLIAYRFYGLYVANTMLRVDGTRQTPAYRHNDGLDYVPTNRYVLYGHHFAAIAGAGPLVGPVLAAQMGYLPGVLWILAGVVFAGAIQDMTVLFLSTRRDGRSLGDMIRSEMGPVTGTIAGLGDAAGDFLLNREHIFQLPVVTLGPHGMPGRGFHQLYRDANPIAGAADRPFEHVGSAKLLAYLLRRDRLVAEGKHLRTGEDFQLRDF